MNRTRNPADLGPLEIKPLTARGEATRRRLLSAAEAEFGEKGFHQASVSSITTRADVGQGTFYLYFRTKEAIFSALVREIGRNLRKFVGVALESAGTRMQAERVGLEAFLQFAAEHPGLYRIVQEAQFVDSAAFREYYERLARGYTIGLEDAAQRGEVAPGDAGARAWAIMGAGHFLGLRYGLWNGVRPPAEVLDATMDFIAHGMAPHRPEASGG